ncbi:MAG: hypothetical protein AUJ28_03805 [Parcubacteria group bacterium CG1_02_37_51]|uniref:Uncharacterized protein n=2 Tax=Candidatus Komeiliibacteriota TaxID=1817908 RepID=A0A2M8DR45_9BACT|nr:MAG: hypothetical protein AUJ28_03805 [Parcubacteria group bacterium CG1_02_37_51]PIY93786.1 MAG: hypothetical protein COY67_03565 [Candidatus Komeilibacteria bacterium CG_4_10_14_0_8_um_filter_37_78]PJC01870.1 MAG: hypothetical protein CO073_02495 [Candidatus Komeilibacteria bacterium CG_4_9_14_0_8_um_filter_36_9]
MKKNIESVIISAIGIEREIMTLQSDEKKIRARWNRRYQSYLRAAEQLAKLTRYHTIKEADLKKRVLAWTNESKSLTALRDAKRKAIEEAHERLSKVNIRIAELKAEDDALQSNVDNIVDQVFALNVSVTAAFEARNTYLNSHVFKQLVEENGSVRSQITFINRAQTRKVVALTNSITLVRPDLAEEAKQLIEAFFGQFKEKIKKDVPLEVQALYQITSELLVEKTTFRIGPTLYRFISLSIDPELFPELKKAQDLLKSSLRSEKTGSYIRLYQRENRQENWIAIKRA